MKITGINNQSSPLKSKSSKTQMDTNFKGHTLLDVFPVPNYETLKGFSYVLSNKQKVIIIPKPGAPVSVNTVVKTGALNETDNIRGISHFLEHLEFDGSKDLKPGGFDKVATSKGANINAHTSTALTAYFFQVAGATKKDLNELIKAHANMIKYPSLPPSQFKKEKEVVIKEINQAKDRPAAEQYYLMLKNLIGIKSEATHVTLGTEDNIRAITRKDVFDYHKKAYTPDNMETYIVGDVKEKDMIKMVDKYFDTKDFQPASNPIYFDTLTDIEKTKIEFLSDPRVGASSVLLGFAGPKNSDAKGAVATEALLGILGNDPTSRISKALLKLDTDVLVEFESASNHPSHSQMIYLEVERMAPGEEQNVLSAIKKTLDGLKTNPVKQKELNKIKNNMLSRFNRQSETSEGITDKLEGYAISGGIDAYTNRIAMIKSLTLDDINNAGEKYFNPEKASVVVLQPESKINKEITFSGKVVNTKNISRKVLPNNLRLILNDNPYANSTSVSLKLGSPIRPPKFGVPDILAAILNTSSAKFSRSRLASIKSEKNLELGISPTLTGFMVTAETDKKTLPLALKLMKEVFFNPALNEKNFAKAKKEVQLVYDSQLLKAKYGAVEEMYGDHYLGVSSRKIKESIPSVTLEDVQKYYNDLMANASADAAVTGHISSVKNLPSIVEEEFKTIGRNFNTRVLSVAESIKTPHNSRVVVQAEKGRTQSEIVQFFHVPTENLKDLAAMTVMDTILGGGLTARLFKDLREKQKLAYQVGSNFVPNDKMSQQAFIIRTDINNPDGQVNDNIEKSLNGFKKHINKMMKTLVTDAELVGAKRSLNTDNIMSLERAGSQNSIILTKANTPEGIEYCNKLSKAINEVTPEDIKRVSKKYLSRPSVISILTSDEAIQKSQKFLGEQGELKIIT